MISLLFPHLPSTPHHSSEVVIIYPDPCMTVGAGISGCSTVFGSSAVENGFLDKRKNTRGRFHRKEVSHLRIYIYYIIISTYTCIYIYMYLYVYIYIHKQYHSSSCSFIFTQVNWQNDKPRISVPNWQGTQVAFQEPKRGPLHDLHGMNISE